MSKSRRRSSRKKSMKTALVILAAAAGAFVYNMYFGYMFGTYQCDKLYQNMEFSLKHKVNMTILGVKSDWKYDVTGGKVIVSNENGESIVFEKSNGTLVTKNVILGNITCSRM